MSYAISLKKCNWEKNQFPHMHTNQCQKYVSTQTKCFDQKNEFIFCGNVTQILSKSQVHDALIRAISFIVLIGYIIGRSEGAPRGLHPPWYSLLPSWT